MQSVPSILILSLKLFEIEHLNSVAKKIIRHLLIQLAFHVPRKEGVAVYDLVGFKICILFVLGIILLVFLMTTCGCTKMIL